MQCRRGTGRFQWNTGGWFGAQVGSTCWLFFAAISFLSQSPALAALFLSCFVVANLVGAIIWINRARVDPYRAMQLLVLVIFAFTTIAMVSADCLGLLRELDQRVRNPRLLYLVLLIFPALMMMFHFRNKVKSNETETTS
jgi:hypothetical protein